MKRIIATPDAPKAVGPYSQAVELNGTLYLSGQLPVDPRSGQMPEGIEAQTRRALDNLGAILAAAGLGYGDIAYYDGRNLRIADPVCGMLESLGILTK